MTPALRDPSPDAAAQSDPSRSTAVQRDPSRHDRRTTDPQEIATLLRHRLIISTMHLERRLRRV